MEAGIDPAFLEFDETVDFRLRKEAWQRYVAEAISTGDVVLGELDGVGLKIGELEDAFISYATYPDVAEWPAPDVELPDLKPVVEELRSYAAHMERLIPTFPVDVGNDALMDKYRRIARLVRQADLGSPPELLEVLCECGNVKAVQKEWLGPEGEAKGTREGKDTGETRERTLAAVHRPACPALGGEVAQSPLRGHHAQYSKMPRSRTRSCGGTWAG